MFIYLYWTFIVKKIGVFFQNFWAFSEYLNFKKAKSKSEVNMMMYLQRIRSAQILLTWFDWNSN